MYKKNISKIYLLKHVPSEFKGVNYLDARSIGSLERGYHSYMKHLNIQISTNNCMKTNYNEKQNERNFFKEPFLLLGQ